MSQLTAHTGRSARLCAETIGAATAAISAVVKKDFIVGKMISIQEQGYAKY